MIELFIKIACIVIIIDIIYLIIPGEKYGNYCKMIVGIITLLSVFNLFTNIDFEFNLNETESEYLTQDNMQEKFNIMVKNDLDNKILNYLKENGYKEVINHVDCKYDGNIIETVVVYVIEKCDFEEIKNYVAEFCNINREKVMVEHL